MLSYHVVPGNVDSSKIQSGETRSVQGSPLSIQANVGSVIVNEAQVIQAGILPRDVQANMEALSQAARPTNPANEAAFCKSSSLSQLRLVSPFLSTRSDSGIGQIRSDPAIVEASLSSLPKL
ncbi:MAG: fasciclin domain-containing protein [Stenomitos frigidus ULC029]